MMDWRAADGVESDRTRKTLPTVRLYVDNWPIAGNGLEAVSKP